MDHRDNNRFDDINAADRAASLPVDEPNGAPVTRLLPTDRIVRGCGIVVAGFSVWLAMAWLGGTPRAAVDWAIVALIAAFGYSFGTLLPALFAWISRLFGRQTTIL